jgi:hypothetical protein
VAALHLTQVAVTQAVDIKMIKQISTMVEARDAIRLLQEFLKETAYEQSIEAAKDIEHLGKLVFTVMNNGFIWISYVDELPVGILIAIKEKNLWAPQYSELRELVWFVLPEHRKSSIGGRLFKTFCDQGDTLLEQSKIDGYFTTRMTTTDSIDLERRGFRLTEKTYLKERT